MKKLTIKNAKELAEKYLLKNRKIDPYHFIHTQKVVQAVKIIGKGRNLDKKTLEICAWLHDIGYSIGNLPNRDPYHAENSIKILIESGFKITDKIKDCILSHGSNGNPKTKEGKILQIAVKFNIIDKDCLDYIINGKSTENKIEFLEHRANSAIKMLKRLKSLKI